MKAYVNTAALAVVCAIANAESIPITETPSVIVSTEKEPVMNGKYEPTWTSLQQYEAPEWFRDAKFGIWAHWGPQCEPEAGDWYARHMYTEGNGQYRSHLEHYGHPSEFGFKDVIHEWKAEKWDPERLVELYKRVGAQYFFAMANHHDNLDMWDSKYQPWNSVDVGPRKNIIAEWTKAARKNGLPFGVSIHAAHAWSWYEVSQGADRNGDKAGVPYDGNLTKADGEGTWWEGLDPQDLYEQRHEPSPGFENTGAIHGRWNWGNGVTQPDQAYCDKFYNRTMDLINQYQPDLIYFDDTALPLWPVSDAGLKIASHFYNSNLKKTNGRSEGVLFGKVLDDDQLKSMVWDIERGVPNRTLPYAWQTDTCIGGWHYNNWEYDHNGYKSAKTVIHMLADIVSKNGNLLLNIPIRGDGSIDDKEEKILEGIAEWMDVNKEAIFATRPWKTFGEGPASEGEELSAQGFNEGKGKPFTAEDIRYTASKDGKTLFAIVMGWPGEGPKTLYSVGIEPGVQGKVSLLGHNTPLSYHANAKGQLVVDMPSLSERQRTIAETACVLKITGLEPSLHPSAAVTAGAIRLPAENALLVEGGLRLEEALPNEQNIGYWDDPSGTANWLATVRQPGRYRVSADLASQQPCELTVDVEGRQVSGTIDGHDYKSPISVDFGVITFEKAGVYRLTVRAADPAHWQAVNLWSVQLMPEIE